MVTIDEVRAFAITLPRTGEGLVRGRVKFRIGRIVYLSLSRDGSTMGFAFPKELRVALVEDAWALCVPKSVVEEYSASKGYR